MPILEHDLIATSLDMSWGGGSRLPDALSNAAGPMPLAGFSVAGGESVFHPSLLWFRATFPRYGYDQYAPGREGVPP